MQILPEIYNTHETLKKLASIFFTGVLISFLGSLPLGTLNMVTLQISISDGVVYAFWFAFGCLTIEMIYVRLLLEFMNKIMKQKGTLKFMNWISLLIIIGLTFSSFIAAAKINTPPKNILLSGSLHPFFLGIFMNIFNPVQIPFWLAWNTLLLSRKVLIPENKYYNTYAVAIGVGSLAGSMLFIVGGKLFADELIHYQHTLYWLIGSVFLFTALLQVRNIILENKTWVKQDKAYGIKLLQPIKNSFYKITHWETWDWRIKYLIIMPVWLWNCLRSGSWWFFTASNPTITFGGFDGESKKEIYDQLPPHSYPKSIYISPSHTYSEVEKLISDNNITYPFVGKPDVAKMGFMFRKIESREGLKIYHESIPANYILQEFITYPIEVSVFYYRFPNEVKGTITGFLKKEFLQVAGNGESTLLDLMLNYPRVRFRLEEMKIKHRNALHHIIPAGEIYCLCNALNLSRGGKLINLEHEKDEKLLKVFDGLSNYTRHFYFGRYDIKCQSIEDLKNGKNYSILEYNGSGAEPHHVYGNGNNLFTALGILIHHWNVLYKISKYNRRNGIPYWKFKHGYKFLRQAKNNISALSHLDSSFPI